MMSALTMPPGAIWMESVCWPLYLKRGPPMLGVCMSSTVPSIITCRRTLCTTVQQVASRCVRQYGGVHGQGRSLVPEGLDVRLGGGSQGAAAPAGEYQAGQTPPEPPERHTRANRTHLSPAVKLSWGMLQYM